MVEVRRRRTPWDGIAYDPEANLIYVGTGNGSPWNANHRSPGGGDNLYLASIVALNADTGKYVWHYQTTPGDNWDYNSAQPMILADLTIGGQPRKVIMQAPKNGFFYVLDRITGKLISGEPYVFTSWATGIDKQTGRPIETEAARYRYTPVRLSPSPVGAHHWPPMAFNPKTGLVYYPGQETSGSFAMEEKFEFKEGQWNLGIHMGRRPGEADAAASAAARSEGAAAWRVLRGVGSGRAEGALEDSVPAQRRCALDGRAADLRRHIGRQVPGARSGGRQDAVGDAADAGRRDADHVSAGRQAVHRGDVGDLKGPRLRLRARCERNDAQVETESRRTEGESEDRDF